MRELNFRIYYFFLSPPKIINHIYCVTIHLTRRELFVGVLDNSIWTVEKLCAYFNKHASTNDEQFVVDCQIMSYNDTRFDGKSFAFIRFTDEVCVDRCMSKRAQFNDDYGITIKRLLPDSISKCERLISSQDLVVRLAESDPLFTEANIRSYFSRYGSIIELKMLEEENTAGICFIKFEDFDSSDRILLDLPHYLNGQTLSIHKYVEPDYVCNLSQFRFIDETRARKIKRWYPISRNLTDLQHPLYLLYKTQIALIKYDVKKKLSLKNEALSTANENLRDCEDKHNALKETFIQISQLNRLLKKQIEDLCRKNDTHKYNYESQIEQQQKQNNELQEAITSLEKHS